MSVVYVRKFDQKTYEESTTDKYPLSRYFPRIMSESLLAAIKNLISPDDYIIGPLYQKGDFQIGMTGTIKEREDRTETLNRELGEEIGLIPHSIELIKSSTYFRNRNRITFSVYAVSIDSCQMVDANYDNIKLNDNRDSKDKIGCYIYGEKDKILAFFSGEIYRYHCPDDIKGLVAIKASDIINSFKK